MMSIFYFEPKSKKVGHFAAYPQFGLEAKPEILMTKQRIILIMEATEFVVQINESSEAGWEIV